MIDVVKPNEAKFDFIGSEVEENLKDINRRITHGIFHINSICGDKNYFVFMLKPYSISVVSIAEILTYMKKAGWEAEFSNEYHAAPFKAIRFRTALLNPKTVNIRTDS